MKSNFENDVKTRAEKSFGFLSWVQEFTKKIVVTTFFLYIVSSIVFLGIGIASYLQSGGEMMYFTTLVTEVNGTFRNIIGGYIVKAAVENAIKISGGIVEKVLNVKFGITDDSDETFIDDDPSGESIEVEG